MSGMVDFAVIKEDYCGNMEAVWQDSNTNL